MNMEEIAMQIVGNAGEARSLAYEGLKYAKKKDFEKANECMKKSREIMYKAHEAQTDLIVAETNGEKIDVNILIIHAQDHLMNAITVQELVDELIEIYKRLD